VCTSRRAEAGSPKRDDHRVNLKKRFPDSHLRRITVNVPTTIDASAWLGNCLESVKGDTDVPPSMLGAYTETLTSTEASLQGNAAF
jgi:hypothetical protein